MSSPSNEKRAALQSDLSRAVRLFIAGSSLYSQRVAEKLGLHPTDLQLLNVLELLGPLTPKVLGQYSGLSSGGVTVALDRLEKEGYIRREANPRDGRSFVVDFSPAKRRKVKAHYDAVEEQFAEILGSSTMEELQTVLAFFAKANAARSQTAAISSEHPRVSGNSPGRRRQRPGAAT
jgi:MarR family transcriptional regulator, organic hydroperoxide resistance regulator